jgi:plasmid maintenance system antidote protein VapI
MAGKQITPAHPGTYLKELVEEFELSHYRLAQDMAVA